MRACECPSCPDDGKRIGNDHPSIVWNDRAPEVTLHRLELETHNVLVADGAPAESYIMAVTRYVATGVVLRAAWRRDEVSK